MSSYRRDERAGQPLGGPPREYTSREKAVNWWDYHRWLVYGLIAVLILAIWMVHDLFFRAEPDVYVSYVGAEALPEDTAADLKLLLTSLAEDVDGDGKVLVQVDQYAVRFGDDSQSDYAAYVSMAQLLSAIAGERSAIFLLEDPAGFQAETGALGYLDGTAPEDGAADWERMTLRWTDCPALTAYGLKDDDARFDGVYLGFRAAFSEEQAEKFSASGALWRAMTSGAQ